MIFTALRKISLEELNNSSSISWNYGKASFPDAEPLTPLHSILTICSLKYKCPRYRQM